MNFLQRIEQWAIRRLLVGRWIKVQRMQIHVPIYFSRYKWDGDEIKVEGHAKFKVLK